MMSFTINNDGVGADGYLTMGVDTTASLDFTQTDLDNGLCACAISGNNEVGMGADGGKLFGKVVSVEDELDDNDIPVRCTVQARGVARFKYVATTPVVGQMVELDGAGSVSQASADTDIAAGGHLMRGQVIAVDTTNETCDVWLG
jgi:hypothetical protein